MSGYQEILTDPSYAGQIITMTYPLIGNYGINTEDMESDKPYLSAYVIKELCENPSNYRSNETLNDFLLRHNIPGIQGIDTRALTRRIREAGAMRCLLTTSDEDVEQLVARVNDIPKMEGSDFSELLINPGNQNSWANITFMRNAGLKSEGKWVAAVTSRYKLVLSKIDEPWLIDMETDPDELINFANEKEKTEVVKELANKLNDYAQKHKDPFLQGTKMADDLKSIL
jgi:carbamoyl-phosphate synthase small subunit